jgi:hypothetical protein
MLRVLEALDGSGIGGIAGRWIQGGTAGLPGELTWPLRRGRPPLLRLSMTAFDATAFARSSIASGLRASTASN